MSLFIILYYIFDCISFFSMFLPVKFVYSMSAIISYVYDSVIDLRLILSRFPALNLYESILIKLMKMKQFCPEFPDFIEAADASQNSTIPASRRLKIIRWWWRRPSTILRTCGGYLKKHLNFEQQCNRQFYLK